MRYKISFSVTERYPEAEVEAPDRNQAVALYQDMWKSGQLSEKGVMKEAQYRIVSPKTPKVK